MDSSPFNSSTNFCLFKESKDDRTEAKKVQSPIRQSCAPSCKKSNGVATWLINGVATVFFTSLERCYCINIDTKDGPDDSISLPFIFFYDGCINGVEAKGNKKGNGSDQNTRDVYLDNEKNITVKYM